MPGAELAGANNRHSAFIAMKLSTESIKGIIPLPSKTVHVPASHPENKKRKAVKDYRGSSAM